MTTFMKNHPDIASRYLLYRDCRELQLFSLETTKGSGKNAKTVVKVIPFPTGFHSLPVEGGLLDQPHRMMEFFNIFLNAERKSAYKSLNK